MIAHVALPLPLHKTFSYVVPGPLAPFAKPLTRVTVPLGNRTVTGWIVTLEDGEGEGLKPIADIIDIFPLIEGASFELCTWASHYYLAPIGLVLKYALPPVPLTKHLFVKALHERVQNVDRLSLKAACALVGKWVLWDYYYQGLVELYDSYTGLPFKPLAQSASAGKHRPGLYIANVTQRKEKYLAAISEKLDHGQNVLMLLPDYHVVGDHFYRFLVGALGKRVLWYTSTEPKARLETFFRARTEKGRLILGNKSAVLMPIADRGMIIVERPEEDEYRNEESFHFHTVKLALKSAELYGTPILLGSASPPLEIVRLTEEGACSIEREQDVCLGRPVSSILTEYQGRDQIPAELTEVIDRTVRNNETMAIYTPRKDYASRLYCLECKKPFLCPECGTVLAYHRDGDRLFCSACKKSIPYDERCAHCGGSLVQFSATGVEFIEERVGSSMPEAHVLKITGESIRKKDVRSLVHASGAPRTILVGTQILSRLYGVRIKRLVLMGQEEFLWIAGYRAHERIYQTFRNLIDALEPDEIFLVLGKKSLIDASNLVNEDQFYKEELSKRRMAEFPPYRRLFLVEIRKNGEAGERLVGRIVERIKEEGFGNNLIGPMRTRRGGVHWRMVLKGDEHLFAEVFLWMYGLSGVRIEPDPPSI